MTRKRSRFLMAVGSLITVAGIVGAALLYLTLLHNRSYWAFVLAPIAIIAMFLTANWTAKVSICDDDVNDLREQHGLPRDYASRK